MSAVGLPLIAGREFGERDRAGAPQVVIVNQTLVNKYFNGESPLGRHITIDNREGEFDAEVIGVTSDFKHGSVKDEKSSFVFIPYSQWDRAMGMTFYVRTTQDPASFGETITRTVRGVDPNPAGL